MVTKRTGRLERMWIDPRGGERQKKGRAGASASVMVTKRTGRLERMCIDPGGGDRTNMERAAPEGKERPSDSPPCCVSTTGPGFTRPETTCDGRGTSGGGR